VKIGAALRVVAAACLSTLVMTPAPALAAPDPASSATAAGLLVSGTVRCAHGQPVDGVWVNSSGGGSSYARLRPTSQSSASYTAWLATSTPTAISLHVGCGGSATNWASENWTPVVLMVTRSKRIDAANCMGGQCTFPSADRAATWAERHLTVAAGGNRALNSDRVADNRAYTSWAGLSLVFAASAYLSAAGVLPRPAVTGSAATANSMYQRYANDHLVQQIWANGSGVSPDPPRGALVFYPSSDSGGQIAISAGAGEVISANSSGSPLVTEQSYKSIPGYQGWAFPSNMVVSRSGSPLWPSATPPLPRRAGAGAAHRAKSAAIAPPSRKSSAGAGNRWLSLVLAGCLVLLAMFATVFAVRAWQRARRRYGRHRHEGAGARAVAASGRNPGLPQPAGSVTGQPAGTGIRRTADVPLVASGRGTAPPQPVRAVPPAPKPPRYEPPAPKPPRYEPPAPKPPRYEPPAPGPLRDPPMAPSLPPATFGEAGGLPPAAELAATHMDVLAAVDRGGLGGHIGGDGPPSPEAAAADGGGGWQATVSPPVFSEAGLRLLGLREAPAGKGAGPVQRYEVVLGECRVEAVLAEAPANSRKGRSPEGRGWVASAPYLVWTPLPHDVPSGGTAFACVGAGQGGCLFIDLAASPGVLTLGGEPQAASRLAESLAHQLCAGPAADRVHLAVVGDAVPAPAPPGAEWVASAAELGSRAGPGPARDTELVFCRPSSDQDVFGLARYVASARHRVVPVVLADLPGAPWSFTAHPSRDPATALQPVVS
jgi:hypothetical protein